MTKPQDQLSLGPASRLLGVDPDTLRRWADAGRIACYTTPGGHRRFTRRELERVGAARAMGAGGTLPPLASLGATAERLARAYRHTYAARPSPGLPALDTAVTDHEREVLRHHGRRLVAVVLAYLDATDAARRAAAEAEAERIVDELARAIGTAAEAPHDEHATRAVAMFVRARGTFLAELGAVARRRALDATRLSHLYEGASELLDRLLLRLLDAQRQEPMPA